MIMEKWKDIPGYEQLYEASTEGKIRSKKGRLKTKDGILKKVKNSKGYNVVTLYKDRKKHQYLVSSLILKTFIPPSDKSLKTIHIDGDIRNDKLSNLRWGTMTDINRIKAANLDKKIIVDNQCYKTYKDMYEKLEMKYNTFKSRKERGWTLQEIVRIPVGFVPGSRPRIFEYNGKNMTLRKIYNLVKPEISFKTVQKRLSRGWNIYEAIEIPNIKNKKVEGK